jgi:diguanylate cyclase (GGDEF)-like protein/PAS domain S-box-containing protein
VDIFVFPEPVLKRKMRQMNIGESQIKVVGKPLMELKRGFLLRRSSHPLAARLNPLIRAYTQSKDYLRDHQKWYGKPQPLWTVDRIAWAMGLMLVAVVAVLILWRYNTIKRLNGRLRESEAQLRTLVESLPDLVWLKDPEGNYVSCNPKFERFFGAREAEIVGKTDYDFVDEELADLFRANDEAAIAAGRSVVNEEVVVFADDGHREHLETIKTPIFDSAGKPIGVLGIARDITKRKQAEERLRTLSQAIEQSPVSVVITDTDGNIEYVNGTFERITGFSGEEVKGRNLGILTDINSSGDLYRTLWQTISSGRAWQGEFHNARKTGEIFWERAHVAPVMNESGAISHYLAVKEDITLRKQQEEKILRQAHFDELTGLPNRFLSLDRLCQLTKEAHRSTEKVAVLFVDLDDFKKINDTLGHETGDKVLVEAARRLNSVVRSGDTVGRLGGDEFIVLLGGLAEAIGARSVAENLIDRFREAFRIDGRELILTASLGIAVYPDDGAGSSELLRNADSAMYHAKALGRNTYSYFTDAMNREVSRRLMLEEQMHGALERGEFSLCYQPQVDVSGGRIVAVEALLRWHSPVLGELSPREFIPIAEQSGLIVPIGQFVLTEALRAAAAWRRHHEPGLRIAVNLSPRQFRDIGLASFIATALERAGLAGESLELEITEGVLLGGHSFVEETLGALNNLGVTIAMDDFGTGYSSLSYLRSYPFQVMKIDRSFVRDITQDPADRELISAAIAMAHGLGLKVVAEGVETEEQLAILAGHGCELAQGYLFGRPVAPAQMAEMLDRQAEPKYGLGT